MTEPRPPLPHNGRHPSRCRPFPFPAISCPPQRSMLALDLSTGQTNPVIHQCLKDTGSNYHTYGTLVTLTEYIFCGKLQISLLRLTLRTIA